MENIEIEKIKYLLLDVYKRLRSKEISNEQAKCECVLLTSIIKAIELDDLKTEMLNLKTLLTKNK